MASDKRMSRLNSLLKEVLSEVIQKDVKNPHIHPLTTITRVDITRDIRQAKVYVSVMGTDDEKKSTVNELNNAAGFIAINSSKKVTLRFFPSLIFKIDDSVDKQVRIESLIHEINQERSDRDD
ncbi:Ribosome-binding factor A [Chlamydiales bacterium SCGC AB-751-O23]|jgi:ribosome-binding factor A|nr:Ribosome-binding factor A [Chlamydiales bacterium SCGC AB-751-O23]